MQNYIRNSTSTLLTESTVMHYENVHKTTKHYDRERHSGKCRKRLKQELILFAFSYIKLQHIRFHIQSVNNNSELLPSPCSLYKAPSSQPVGVASSIQGHDRSTASQQQKLC